MAETELELWKKFEREQRKKALEVEQREISPYYQAILDRLGFQLGEAKAPIEVAQRRTEADYADILGGMTGAEWQPAAWGYAPEQQQKMDTLTNLMNIYNQKQAAGKNIESIARGIYSYTTPEKISQIAGGGTTTPLIIAQRILDELKAQKTLLPGKFKEGMGTLDTGRLGEVESREQRQYREAMNRRGLLSQYAGPSQYAGSSIYSQGLGEMEKQQVRQRGDIETERTRALEDLTAQFGTLTREYGFNVSEMEKEKARKLREIAERMAVNY